MSDEKQAVNGSTPATTTRAAPATAATVERIVSKGARTTTIKSSPPVAVVVPAAAAASDIGLASTAGGATRVCVICTRSIARYTCSQCQIPYCSSDCYRLHGAECVNSFHARNVVSSMSGTRATRTQQRDMQSMLRRLHHKFFKTTSSSGGTTTDIAAAIANAATASTALTAASASGESQRDEENDRTGSGGGDGSAGSDDEADDAEMESTRIRLGQLAVALESNPDLTGVLTDEERARFHRDVTSGKLASAMADGATPAASDSASVVWMGWWIPSDIVTLQMLVDSVAQTAGAKRTQTIAIAPATDSDRSNTAAVAPLPAYPRRPLLQEVTTVNGIASGGGAASVVVSWPQRSLRTDAPAYPQFGSGAGASVRSVTSARPSPLLIYNTIDLLYAYAFGMRRCNGDVSTPDAVAQVVEAMIGVSPVLTSSAAAAAAASAATAAGSTKPESTTSLVVNHSSTATAVHALLESVTRTRSWSVSGGGSASFGVSILLDVAQMCYFPSTLVIRALAHARDLLSFVVDEQRSAQLSARLSSPNGAASVVDTAKAKSATAKRQQLQSDAKATAAAAPAAASTAASAAKIVSPALLSDVKTGAPPPPPPPAALAAPLKPGAAGAAGAAAKATKSKAGSGRTEFVPRPIKGGVKGLLSKPAAGAQSAEAAKRTNGSGGASANPQSAVAKELDRLAKKLHFYVLWAHEQCAASATSSGAAAGFVAVADELMLQWRAQNQLLIEQQKQRAAVGSPVTATDSPSLQLPASGAAQRPAGASDRSGGGVYQPISRMHPRPKRDAARAHPPGMRLISQSKTTAAAADAGAAMVDVKSPPTAATGTAAAAITAAAASRSSDSLPGTAVWSAPLPSAAVLVSSSREYAESIGSFTPPATASPAVEQQLRLLAAAATAATATTPVTAKPAAAKK